MTQEASCAPLEDGYEFVDPTERSCQTVNTTLAYRTVAVGSDGGCVICNERQYATPTELIFEVVGSSQARLGLKTEPNAQDAGVCVSRGSCSDFASGGIIVLHGKYSGSGFYSVGDIFVASRSTGPSLGRVGWTSSAGDGTYGIELSCSEPLVVGNVFGPLKLIGSRGAGCPAYNEALGPTSICSIKCAAGYRQVSKDRYGQPRSKQSHTYMVKRHSTSPQMEPQRLVWPPGPDQAYCSTSAAAKSHKPWLNFECVQQECPKKEQTPPKCTSCPVGFELIPDYVGVAIRWDHGTGRWSTPGCERISGRRKGATPLQSTVAASATNATNDVKTRPGSAALALSATAVSGFENVSDPTNTKERNGSKSLDLGVIIVIVVMGITILGLGTALIAVVAAQKMRQPARGAVHAMLGGANSSVSDQASALDPIGFLS